jgi:two-component system, sensor histidine kinase and response regulator
MRARILVVEGDLLQQAVLRSVLEASEFEVETVSDGLSAVWKIREGHYDLVVLGYKLPEIDGLAVARLVGDLMGEAARPRLVALAAFPEAVRARELLNGKVFDEVIAKWADLPKLLSPLISTLPVTPEGVAQDAAQVDLFLTAWDEYETVPERVEIGANDKAIARVLVVEDDEIQRAVLRAAFDAEGYEVETAADGLTAVRMMRAVAYDLALIDYELPEVDGLATARLISDLMGEGIRPQLVAFTASPDALASRAARLGRVFDEIIGKQADLPALLALVKRRLSRSMISHKARRKPEPGPQTGRVPHTV